jgi:hypothetical protein
MQGVKSEKEYKEAFRRYKSLWELVGAAESSHRYLNIAVAWLHVFMLAEQTSTAVSRGLEFIRAQNPRVITARGVICIDKHQEG